MGDPYPRVAVVDDEASVLKALGRLFRSAGMAVETFGSGAEFLAFIANHSFDCLIVDLHMEGMSGFDVQRELARRKIRVPVIVITGRDSVESRARASAGGADKFLLKPVDGKLMLDSIAELIWNR